MSDTHVIPQPRQPASDLAWHLGVCIAFIVFARFFWSSALTEFFAQDDFLFLEAARFRHTSWSAMFAALLDVGAVDNGYRPLSTTFYFFAMYRLFGLDPVPFHVVSLLLHTAVSLCIYGLTWSLVRNRSLAIVAGFFFLTRSIAYVPVHWACIVQDLFACLFMLLCMLIAIRYLHRGGMMSLVGIMLTLTLAVASKEVAIVVPVCLPALALASHQISHVPLRRAVIASICAAMVAGIFFLVRLYVTSNYHSPYAVGIPAIQNLLAMFYLLVWGTSDLNWPLLVPLSLGYTAIILAGLLRVSMSRRADHRKLAIISVALLTVGIIFALPVLALHDRWVDYYAYIPGTMFTIAMFASLANLLPDRIDMRRVVVPAMIVAAAASAVIELDLNNRKDQNPFTAILSQLPEGKIALAVEQNPDYLFTGGWLTNISRAVTASIRDTVLTIPSIINDPPPMVVFVGLADVTIGSNLRGDGQSLTPASTAESMMRVLLNAPDLKVWHLHHPNLFPDLPHNYAIPLEQIHNILDTPGRHVIIILVEPRTGIVEAVIDARATDNAAVSSRIDRFLNVFVPAKS